jgi:hypothetical protein
LSRGVNVNDDLKEAASLGWFKSGQTMRELLLKDDEIDEKSLTQGQRNVLTKNHQKLMKDENYEKNLFIVNSI